jgi:hydroxypyruvate isomerase
MAGTLFALKWAGASPVAQRARFSAMLWTLEKHASFDRCLEMAAAAGYQGVELTGEFRTWTPAESALVMARIRSLGLVVDTMGGVKAGFAVPAEAGTLRALLAEEFQAMDVFECRRVILLSGKRVEGMSAQAQRDFSVENLKRVAEMAARKGIEVVIEPIDLLENPTIFLASVRDGLEIVEAVNAPNVKLLYDLYHEQRSFGNLIEKLEKSIDRVGLIHVADVPGRHEPGTGEIDFANIYRKLGELHYDGWIAMEYYPTAEPVASLRQARIEAQKAMAAR